MFLHELSELREVGARVTRAYFGSLAVLVSCEESRVHNVWPGTLVARTQLAKEAATSHMHHPICLARQRSKSLNEHDESKAPENSSVAKVLEERRQMTDEVMRAWK